MADNPFSDLIPQKGAENPFADLIPAKKREPSITDAITDIPAEIGTAAGNAIDKIKALGNRSQQGPIEGLMTTGRAVLAVPELAMSPITGAARSLIGHPMAQAEHAVGSIIAPEIAAKDDPQKMYEAAKGDVDLAMSALATRKPSTALSAAGEKPNIKVKAPTIDELKESATKSYESPEVKNLAVKPTVVRNFGEAAETALANEGFDPVVAEKTFALLRNLQKVPEQSVITGGNLNTLRRMFSKAAQSADKTEAAAASKVIGFLDDALTKVPGSEVISGDLPAAASRLESARGDYAAASQAENIDNKLISAELRAASTNSGQNVANTIRQRMAALVDPTKPKEGVGLKPDELASAETIARGTTGQNALRSAGNYLRTLHGGTIGATIGATIGGPAGAAVGATAVPALGALMKATSNKMTIRQAERLSEMIRSRAPLASSAQKFEEAAARVASSRDPKAIAGVVLAARNLSTNMRSVGLNFSPADLLSGLQSPSGGQAQEQQQVPGPPGQ